MLSFSRASPFPHLSAGAFSEREARAHAAEVDQWLGFKTQPIEAKLAAQGCRLSAPNSGQDKQELWFGLDVQMLLTPYVELRQLLEQIAPQPGQTVVDLGAAYGRMGFVLSRHFPEARFHGYEYVGERVEEARRVLKTFAPQALCTMEHADLASSDFRPAEAELYFIYDYGTPKAIEKTLHDLRRIAQHRPIQVIARGRHARYIIESRHSWLVNVHSGAPETRATVYGSDFGAGLGSGARASELDSI